MLVLYTGSISDGNTQCKAEKTFSFEIASVYKLPGQKVVCGINITD